MVIILTGASHTGKTALAHQLMLKTNSPYLSQDHLKMGLIRSKNTDLSVEEDALLTKYLWPITVGMIKTAIENKQDLIVEGAYVPCDWISSFEDEYLQDIRFLCLVFSENYIRQNFESIKLHANVIETRQSDDISMEALIKDNAAFLAMCEDNLYPYQLIEDEYYIDDASVLI